MESFVGAEGVGGEGGDLVVGEVSKFERIERNIFSEIVIELSRLRVLA